MLLYSTANIINNSVGEITVPNTIDYQTKKPVTGGLFCEKLFGDTIITDCDDYKGMPILKLWGKSMDFSYITLNDYYVNPTAYDVLAICLHLKREEVRNIALHKQYVAIFENKEFILVPDKQINKLKKNAKVLTGGQAIKELINDATLLNEKIKIMEEWQNEKEDCRDDFVNDNRYRIITSTEEEMKTVPVSFESVVVDLVPVIPPAMRPVFELEYGLAGDTINETYEKILELTSLLKSPDKLPLLARDCVAYQIQLILEEILGEE